MRAAVKKKRQPAPPADKAEDRLSTREVQRLLNLANRMVKLRAEFKAQGRFTKQELGAAWRERHPARGLKERFKPINMMAISLEEGRVDESELRWLLEQFGKWKAIEVASVKERELREELMANGIRDGTEGYVSPADVSVKKLKNHIKANRSGRRRKASRVTGLPGGKRGPRFYWTRSLRGLTLADLLDKSRWASVTLACEATLNEGAPTGPDKPSERTPAPLSLPELKRLSVRLRKLREMLRRTIARHPLD
jgi:hypothetical protein